VANFAEADLLGEFVFELGDDCAALGIHLSNESAEHRSVSSWAKYLAW
jgi:hypothetical protein